MRRDFLKLLGALLISPLMPRGIDMPIGTLIKRALRGDNMTPQDLSRIELYFNQAEMEGAYIRGTQTGNSDVTAQSVNATFGEFKVPPNNASYFGSNLFTDWPQDFEHNTLTKFGAAFADSIVTPQSFIHWYDRSNYQFHLNPSFSKITNQILWINGVMLNEVGTSVYRGIRMDWFRKADDSLYKPFEVYYALNAPRTFAFSQILQFNDFDEDPADLYFEMHGQQNAGSTQGVAISMAFSRLL